MEWLIFNLYKQKIKSDGFFDKERFQIGWVGFIVYLIEGIAITIAIYRKNEFWYGIGFFSMIITFLILINFIDKRYYPKVAIERYNRKFNILNNILSECDILKNRDKNLPYLIKKIEVILETLHVSKKIYKIVKVGFGTIIFPIASLIIANNSFLAEKIIDSRNLIITTLFQLLGLWLILRPFLEIFLDSDYIRLKELHSLLSDIYHLDR